MSTYTQIANKPAYYTKKLTGTNGCWYQVNEQRKAAISVFWKLSFAEHYWLELNCLVNNSEVFSPTVSEHREHILDYT